MRRLDEFWCRHPGLLFGLVVLLAVAVTLVFLYRDQAPAVVYENF